MKNVPKMYLTHRHITRCISHNISPFFVAEERERSTCSIRGNLHQKGHLSIDGSKVQKWASWGIWGVSTCYTYRCHTANTAESDGKGIGYFIKFMRFDVFLYVDFPISTINVLLAPVQNQNSLNSAAKYLIFTTLHLCLWFDYRWLWRFV